MGEAHEQEFRWVVRSGVATPRQLQEGTRQHSAVPNLYGFSVQYEVGVPIEELVEAGQFPHPRISVTMEPQLIAAARAAGYSIRVVKSPGRGFHCTVEVPYPLSDDLAVALSTTFVHCANPALVRRS